MLNTQEIQKQLNQFKINNLEEYYLNKIKNLNQDLSALAQILLQIGPEWENRFKNSNDFLKMETRCYEILRRLNFRQRRRFFSALFPKIAEEIALAWELINHLPYQSPYQYERRAFRTSKPDFFRHKVWIINLIRVIKLYDQDIEWFATWAAHLANGYFTRELSCLFAAVLNQGGEKAEKIYSILVDSANGNHAIGRMGRHVVHSLLVSDSTRGWEFIKNLLLAAQREEGLRQTILEYIDESHPTAFKRMLRLILDHQLLRFSAAIRAVSVWFGIQAEVFPITKLTQFLEFFYQCLDQPQKPQKTITQYSPEEAYLVIWAAALSDVNQALPLAKQLYLSPQSEYRFIALKLFKEFSTAASHKELFVGLVDPDLHLAVFSANLLHHMFYSRKLVLSDQTFEQIEHIILRINSFPFAFKSPVWSWMDENINQNILIGLLFSTLENRSPKRLLPYLPLMDPFQRSRLISLFKEIGENDAEVRKLLFTMIGDRSSTVQFTALKAIESYQLTPEEISLFEDYLSRKSQELRRSLLLLLMQLDDSSLITTIQNLINRKNQNQRLAGLDLLRTCAQQRRFPDWCLNTAREFEHNQPTPAEQIILDEILDNPGTSYTLENALGLMDPENCTKPIPPQKKEQPVIFSTETTFELLKSLEALIEDHRNTPYKIIHWKTTREVLLGNENYFPEPDLRKPLEEDINNFALREIWQNWWENRPATMQDPNGLELIRAWAVLSYLINQVRYEYFRSYDVIQPPKIEINLFSLPRDFTLNHTVMMHSIIRWLIRIYPPKNGLDFLLDALEENVRLIPAEDISRVYLPHINAQSKRRVLDIGKDIVFLDLCRTYKKFFPNDWKKSHSARLWYVLRWIDQPKPRIERILPEFEEALGAWDAGAATQDDLFDLILSANGQIPYGYRGTYQILFSLSTKKPARLITQYPQLTTIITACRERILEIEQKRGDLPTAASPAALSINYVPGIEHLFKLLAALGDLGYSRSYFNSSSKQDVLSHLIRVSYPLDEDTPEKFSDKVQEYQISEKNLVELAVYAPQWANIIESVLDWPKFEETVFWVYAHTKDRVWRVPKDLLMEWTAKIGKYTPITNEELLDGAVDVQWFNRAYHQLGKKRWQFIHNAAKYSASGSGHTRAKLFAAAMIGDIHEDDLIKRIREKRNQDSIRALGLVPLPIGDQQKQIVLKRYEIFQEVLRTSKKFGSQRQSSEKLAVSIGLENLARTAGYEDPLRMEWAMEIEAMRDLINNPSVTIGATTVVLKIDSLGEAHLTVEKNGKPLKSIPAALKKEEQIVYLVEKSNHLKKQTSRMRFSLEKSMCRGDKFSAAELGELFTHPTLKPMLEQIIFTSPDGMGVPSEQGSVLIHHSGKVIPIQPQTSLTIAHPLDLYQSQEWHLWQRECFLSERIQPFKQIFRELYLLTETEKNAGHVSNRYAGQQLNPKQAVALLNTRGWVVNPAEGVYKTDHKLGITAQVDFLFGAFTPAEVENPTMEGIWFSKRGEWGFLPLEKIPPRFFSEVMRDLDLVVSVAHAGGVDPEASLSSIEARSALVNQTSSLLKLSNVKTQGNYILIDGNLANYNIHLGSGTVHKQPGGALCIIPVHSQHRGRLFLPFVDQDPKTAEIVSKVILLARDQQIKDPTILEQILR